MMDFFGPPRTDPGSSRTGADPVSEKVELVAWRHDTGLVAIEIKSPGTQQRVDLAQRSLRLAEAGGENDEVVGITRHGVASGCHQAVDGVQVDVRQQGRY